MVAPACVEDYLIDCPNGLIVSQSRRDEFSVLLCGGKVIKANLPQLPTVMLIPESQIKFAIIMV